MSSNDWHTESPLHVVVHVFWHLCGFCSHLQMGTADADLAYLKKEAWIWCSYWQFSVVSDISLFPSTLLLYYLFSWCCFDCCKSRLEMLWASGPRDAITSPRVLYRRWRLLLLVVAWTECICSSWQSHWQSGGRALTLMNLLDYRVVCLSKRFAATQLMSIELWLRQKSPRMHADLWRSCKLMQSIKDRNNSFCWKLFQNMLILHFKVFLVPS